MKAIFVSLFLTACASTATSENKPLGTNALKQYQACSHADQCIRVDNSCCNCANGGETISINRKFEVPFRQQFPCRMVVCSQKAGDCIFRVPNCVKGFCELIALKDAPQFPAKK